MAEYKGQEGLAGIWLDEHQLTKAAKKTNDAGFTQIEAISPFPLHGIDEALDIPRSFIPWVSMTMGMTGLLFGLWFTWWTSAVDWPLNIGGKPMWSLPAFIPVIFELVILFSALSAVSALIIKAGLPKLNPPIIDKDLTSHKFALFIPKSSKNFDEAKITSLFSEMGAAEVKSTRF